MIPYYIGCAALGLTAGFLIGGSASPVVQNVLPLLFALLGGAAGVLGLTTNPKSESAVQRFRIIGIAATSVSVPLLVAAAYGSLLRTGTTVKALVPHLESTQYASVLRETDIATLGPEDSVYFVLLDRNLSLLSISAEERTPLVRHLVEQRINSINAFAEKRTELVQTAKDLLSAIRNAVAKYEAPINGDIFELQSALSLLTQGNSDEFLTRPVSEGGSIDVVQKLLSGETTSNAETDTFLSNHETVGPLAQRVRTILRYRPTAAPISSDLESRIAQQLPTAAPLQQFQSTPETFSLFAIEPTISDVFREGRT